jgi:hypothetical protein
LIKIAKIHQEILQIEDLKTAITHLRRQIRLLMLKLNPMLERRKMV